MFFRRSKQDTAKPRAIEPEEAAKAASEPLKLDSVTPEPVRGVAVAAEAEKAPAEPKGTPSGSDNAPMEPKIHVDPKALGFETTADLEPEGDLIGQERALEALAFGAGMKGPGYNMLVVGPAGSGRHTAARTKLEATASKTGAPPDWVYVSSFDSIGSYRALKFPSGTAKSFAEGMARAIDRLKEALPAAFGAEDYELRRRTIEEEFRFSRADALEALRRQVEPQNIAVLSTPAGIAVAPILEGKVVSTAVFNSVPEQLRNGIEAKIAAVETEIESILARTPDSEKMLSEGLMALNEQVAGRQVSAALEEVKCEFEDISGVKNYLKAAARDLVRNAGLFVSEAGKVDEGPRVPINTTGDPRFARYRVHVMAARGVNSAAPIVQESNPTYANLFGRIECGGGDESHEPQLVRIRPGALHRANGGFIFLDARALLAQSAVMDALLRALSECEIRFDPPAEPFGVSAGEMPELEPIALDVKVAVFGEAADHRQLAKQWPDLRRLFKVEARFDDTIDRSQEAVAAYARLIAGIVTRHSLKPVDCGAVAVLIDEASRRAGGNGKLSLEVGEMADLCREADHWAGSAGRTVTSIADIERALEQRNERAADARGGSVV
ncbi:MAG: AAA family ATPase [Hyphomicrobium sp.]